MKFRILILSVVVLLMVLLTGCRDENPVVAEAGKIKITKKEFLDHLKTLSHKGQVLNDFTQDELITQVSVLMNRKIEFLIAEDEGILDSPIIKTRSEIMREMEMVRYLQQYIINEKFLTEKEKKAYYWDKHRSVEYKQIVLNFVDKKTASAILSKEQAIDLGHKLKVFIQSGLSFDSLVTEYSHDRDTRDKGGYVGWKLKSSLEPELAEALFSAPSNSIVGPIVTKSKVYIFLVLNKKLQQPSKTYNEMEHEIEQELKRRLSFKINAFMQRYTNELKGRYNLKINNANVDHFLKLAEQWNSKGNLPLDSLFFMVYDLPLIEGNNFAYPGHKLLFQLRNFKQSYARLKDKTEMMKFLNSGISYLSLLNRAYELDFHELPDIKFNYESFLENAAITELHKKWRSEIKNSQDELKSYYEQNKNKFKSPEKIEVWEMAFKDQNAAERAYNKLKKRMNKKTFEAMAKTLSAKKTSARHGGYLGYLIKGQKPEISNLAFKYGPDALIPPTKIEIYHYIFMTGKYEPERIKTFDEASLEVDKILFTEKFQAKRNQKIEAFRSKITPFTIYEGRLRD
ncbi:MAG: hypothetical protein Kow00108_18950 [Calditrichia bacterium]